MQTLQLLLSGLAQGLIYALLAFGYNVTFATSRTFNFALGSFLMFGGVVGVVLYMNHGWPFWAVLPAALLLGMVGGLVLERIAIRPSLKSRSAYNWILATLAIGIVVRNAVEVFWSTDDFKLGSPLGDDPIRIGEVGIFPQEVLIILCTVAIVVAVELFKQKTIFGKAVQAVSEDRDTASLMGINQRYVILVSFMLSSAMACFAGLLIGPTTFVSATMGTKLGVKAYAVSIIGGLESSYGVLVGGAVLGLSEALTARYVSTGYKDIPGFILLILVLLYRPTGLFGRTAVQKF
jgi:branched-chain amino acid transport system permease protein